jgi:hypothetical protein
MDGRVLIKKFAYKLFPIFTIRNLELVHTPKVFFVFDETISIEDI